MVRLITVDDTNTVQLKYDDKWFHGNWTDTSTQPPSNRSLLSSNFPTAQMFLVFPVAGTGIAYYGMKRSGGGSFRICIDCDPNQPAGPFDTIDAVNLTDDGHNPPVLLYSKQGLKNDMHTVVLMNTNDTRVRPQGSSQITLDRFEITLEDLPVTTVTDSARRTATASVVPSASSSRKSSAQSKLITGSVIGAIVVLLLIVGFLFLCWRRKRRMTMPASVEDGQTSNAFTPDPLIIRRSQHGHQQTPSGSTLHLMSSSNTPATLHTKGPATINSPPDPRITRPPSPPLPSLGDPVFRASSQIISPNAASLAHNPQVETDAGPVREQEDTLPPDYAQVFNSRPALEPPTSSSTVLLSDERAGPRRNRKRS